MSLRFGSGREGIWVINGAFGKTFREKLCANSAFLT